MKRAGLDPSDIACVLLTHLHGDHFGGLPFLILDGQFARRSRSLVIGGPPGVRQRVEAAMEVFFPGSSKVDRRFPVEFVELRERVLALAGPASVTPFVVERGRREPQAPATRRSRPPQSVRYDPRPLGSEIWSVLSRSLSWYSPRRGPRHGMPRAGRTAQNVPAGRTRNCMPDNVPAGLAPKALEKLGSNTFLVVRLPFARPALVKYGRGSIASPLHHRPSLGRTITWKCRCGSHR